MKHRLFLRIAPVLALSVLSACERDRAGGVAPTAARPAIEAAVGPTPGPPDYHARAVSNPFDGDRTARVQGRRLFTRMNCAGCHGDHGGGGMGPSLRDEDWIYGNADAQIFSTIAEGRAHGMPAWGTRLPGEQIWQLVSYIKTLRTAAEPEPPL